MVRQKKGEVYVAKKISLATFQQEQIFDLVLSSSQLGLDLSSNKIVDAAASMSRHLEIALSEQPDEEENEEYFSNSAVRPSSQANRPPSRNRVKNRSTERPDMELEVPVELDAANRRANDRDESLESLRWTDPDERAHPNTPISAYLNAFFMTIATVLVRTLSQTT